MNRQRLCLAALAVFGLLIAPSTVAAASDPVSVIDWSEEKPLSGVAVGDSLVIDASEGGVYPLVVIEAPPLDGGDIVVTVPVVVGEVTNPGFLELWAVYDDGGRFFSRSLDSAGIGLLRSDRSLMVELPFSLDGTTPDSLELNAVLPDGGRLEIGTVRLFVTAPGATPPFRADDDGWWSHSTAGLIGGVTGGIIGLFGALVGWLAARGSARRFVVRTMIAGAVLGVVALGSGAFALALGQPYRVWFPLLLLGTIGFGVVGTRIRPITARYEALELQRMRAYDAA